MSKLTAIVICLVTAMACAAATASMPLTGQSSMEEILDALHARGEGLKDFSGDVSLSEADSMTGGATTQTGKVWYRAGEGADARLHASFDTRKVGSRAIKNAKVQYLLADGWLYERTHERKFELQRQVLKPGQKIDLLKLGEGPFPLLVGQKREEVLKLFEVKKVEPAKDDLEGTVHIHLVPRPKTEFTRRFKTMDIWVDRKTSFPRRIVTVDPNEMSTKTTDLTNFKVNQSIAKEDLELPKLPGDWTIKREAME